MKLREVIRKASGETIDLKSYEADMRHLIDTYIEASHSRKVSQFDDMGLLELIVKLGIDDAINRLPEGIKGNPGAVAETIANNVRSRIVKDQMNDPAYYDRMSALLNEVIADLRAKRISYAEYLKRVADIAKNVKTGHADDTPEPLKKSPALRALYNNLQNKPVVNTQVGENDPEVTGAYDPVLKLAQAIDEAVRRVRPDDWRGVQAREQVIKAALYGILKDVAEVERIFLIVKQQPEY